MCQFQKEKAFSRLRRNSLNGAIITWTTRFNKKKPQ